MKNVKTVAMILSIGLLAGCDRWKQTTDTLMSGYSVKCIQGTKYVIVDDPNGIAISVLYDTNGKPIGCEEKVK